MKKLISLLAAVVLFLGFCTGGASALWSAAAWEKSYYLDPFGDATENYYLGMTKRASGSFKSGSVTDGVLEAELRVDENRVCILLYENGDEQVRNTLHESIGFSVLMKAADGTKTQLRGTMASGGDCVEIWEDQAQSILHFPDRTPQENPVAAALCAEDGEVSFYLTREDQPATSYLFTVRTGNFAALYETEIVTPIRESAYASAEALLAENEYDGAISLFTALGDYRDSAARAAKADAARIEALNAEAYAKAEALLAAKDYDSAIAAFTALGDYRDSAARMNEAREELKELHAVQIEAGKKPIAAGGYHTVGLQADGSVVAVGSNDYNGNYCGQCEVSGWSDIIAIAAGGHHTVGLRADGSVVAVGYDEDGRCEVTGWSDIVTVVAGDDHTVGLRADGSVVAVGANYTGQCEVSDWTDIVAVAAGLNHTVGLRSDGHVIAVGDNEYGQCNVSDWTNIVAVAAGYYHTVGLRADGSVVAVGFNEDGRCEVSDWTGIVTIAANNGHTVGLKADGTVFAVGRNEECQCEASGWTNIVAAVAGRYHTVGLKADGTVVAVGSNNFGQCEVSGWTDIRLP